MIKCRWLQNCLQVPLPCHRRSRYRLREERRGEFTNGVLADRVTAVGKRSIALDQRINQNHNILLDQI